MNPDGIAVTPDGKTVFVGNANSGTISPIDVATRTAGASIPVAADSSQLAITPDGSTVWVACGGPTSTLVPVDVATRTVGAPVAVNPDAAAIAITPDGATALVGNCNTVGRGQTTIQTVNLRTRTAGSTIPVGHNPDAIAITPDQAPIARLSVTGRVFGQPTSFDASASTVRYGTITSYAWNFGDGSPTVTTTIPSTTHVYARGGSYTVTVTEIDSAGTSTPITTSYTGQTLSRGGDPSAVATTIVQILGFTG